MASEAAIKAQIKNLEKELKKYKNRKKALENIRKNAPRKFDNEASLVNINVTGCAQNVAYALEGNRNVSDLAEDIRSYKQSGSSEDPFLGPALGRVDAEIKRCEDKIIEIQELIKKLKEQLRRLQEKAGNGGGGGGTW